MLAVLLIAFSVHANEDKQVKIATFDWCPAICPGKSNPGYIVEIVRAAYAEEGYQIELDYYPWLRAIHQTKTGQSDALLSPAKNEAPTLLYPEHEVGMQKTCFFVRKDDEWKYIDATSFTGRKVAVVLGNSLEELNKFAEKNPQIFLRQNSEDFLPRAIKMFDLKRIDTMVYTESEAEYHFKLHNKDEFKNAGCVNEVKLYIAFSPKNSTRSKTLISVFDRGMKKLKKTKAIEETLKKYGLKSWL